MRVGNCLPESFSQWLSIPSSDTDRGLDSRAKGQSEKAVCVCVCIANSLQRLQPFNSQGHFLFWLPPLLSSSCHFILQPQIPVPRHERVYWYVGNCLGMHGQSDVWRKLMNNHESKRSIGLRELKGLFLWLNSGNAISFLSTDFSIISW